MAFDVSDSTKEILTIGHWEVRVVAAPPGGSSARKAVLLDARRSGRPQQLLERALYWDVDHFPLRSGARHLDALWSAHPEAEMVGKAESSGCFNGGLLLFRPSVTRRAQYQRLINASHPPHTCRRLAKGGDQQFLNGVFKPAGSESRVLNAIRADYPAEEANHVWFAPLNASSWAVRTPLSKRGGGCLPTAGSLERAADSFHFFSRQPPWGGNCAQCVKVGLPCHAELAKRAGYGAPQCSGSHSAHVLWHQAYARLPEAVRRLCDARISDVSAIEEAWQIKDGLRGAGALAGCNVSAAALPRPRGPRPPQSPSSTSMGVKLGIPYEAVLTQTGAALDRALDDSLSDPPPPLQRGL